MPQDNSQNPGAADLDQASREKFPDKAPAHTQACPGEVELTIYIRRDFPTRARETLGDWGWSDKNGNRLLDPIVWEAGADGSLETNTPDADLDKLIGWGIGNPKVQAEGKTSGGMGTDAFKAQKTTKVRQPDGTVDKVTVKIPVPATPIKAQVRLEHNGRVLGPVPTDGVHGKVVLKTCDVDEGPATLIIEPDGYQDAKLAGTDLSSTRTRNTFLFRKVSIAVELKNGEFSKVTDPYDPPANRTFARIGNKKKHAPTPTILPVSLKPDWWAGGNGVDRNNIDVDLVVLHCTSGPRIGPALARWIYDREQGPHYAIDIDGHVIKMEDDDKALGTVAGTTDRWERHSRTENSTSRSVNIEIVNPKDVGPAFRAYAIDAGTQPYTPEQYRSVIRLCKELKSDFPAIKHRFVGHSDVACNTSKVGGLYILGSRKDFDPGRHFEWERLEAADVGMKLGFINLEQAYDGAFVLMENLELRENDRDPANGAPASYADSANASFQGKPIAKIQSDLSQIGYTINDRPNHSGIFDAWLTGAVERFQIHFFSGTRMELRTGRVDAATASAIRFVCKSITGV